MHSLFTYFNSFVRIKSYFEEFENRMISGFEDLVRFLGKQNYLIKLKEILKYDSVLPSLFELPVSCATLIDDYAHLLRASSLSEKIIEDEFTKRKYGYRF